LKFGILPPHSFLVLGLRRTKAIAIHRITILFIFSKVNPLTVPRVDQALALMHPVFDHFALMSEIISSILE
jgi:hypothetical protein